MTEEGKLRIERVSRREDVAILELAGELVITSREALARRAETEVADGARHLVVEVGRLTHVDTSGLALLVRLANRCAESGGRLAVAGLPEDFREIRRYLFLDEALVFAESVEDAVAALAR